MRKQARMATTMDYTDNIERLLIGRASYEVFANDLEAQWPRGQIRTNLTAAGKLHKITNCFENLPPKISGSDRIVGR